MSRSPAGKRSACSPTAREISTLLSWHAIYAISESGKAAAAAADDCFELNGMMIQYGRFFIRRFNH